MLAKTTYLAMRRAKRRLDADKIEGPDLHCPLCQRTVVKGPIIDSTKPHKCCDITLRVVLFSDKKKDEHYATLTAEN